MPPNHHHLAMTCIAVIAIGFSNPLNHISGWSVMHSDHIEHKHKCKFFLCRIPHNTTNSWRLLTCSWSRMKLQVPLWHFQLFENYTLSIHSNLQLNVKFCRSVSDVGAHSNWDYCVFILLEFRNWLVLHKIIVYLNIPLTRYILINAFSKNLLQHLYLNHKACFN